MLNINIEEVESVLLEKHFDPVKVAEVIKELEEIAAELAAEKAKEAAEIPDEDGLPADVGAGDVPKLKWEYVIVLNDKEGYLKDKEIAGWVVQQEENADAGLVLHKLKEAAKDQNEKAKRKKNAITTLEDLFDGLKAKFLKSKNIKIQDQRPYASRIVKRKVLMKKKLQRQIDDVLSKINRLTRHIRNVEDNCILLGTKLIQRGDIELGHKLIANGMVHDASKFSGVEFENLSGVGPCKEETSKLKLKMAIHHHQKTNLHHPEAWAGGIKNMPDVYLAEFCCDSKARSEEFGTSLREWIDESATKKWQFTKDDVVYKKIMEFIDLLCDKPFEEIK